MTQILIFVINIQIVYILPNCTSQSPAGGDGNLLGHHVRQQQANHKEALKKLAEGSADYFPIITIDAGKNQIQLNYYCFIISRIYLTCHFDKSISFIVIEFSGFEIFGNITRNEENFIDYRDVIEEAGAVWIGIFRHSSKKCTNLKEFARLI